MGFPSIIDSITNVKTLNERHEENVRVRFDVTFTFDKDDIDFSNKLESIRGAAESLLSRISAEDMKKKILFETSADFYYTDNNGVETEI
tara:strand:+ start:155 stop:421 length:267 start_codon:yes stop_codon:yes gene_type:complete